MFSLASFVSSVSPHLIKPAYYYSIAYLFHLILLMMDYYLHTIVFLPSSIPISKLLISSITYTQFFSAVIVLSSSYCFFFPSFISISKQLIFFHNLHPVFSAVIVNFSFLFYTVLYLQRVLFCICLNTQILSLVLP